MKKYSIILVILIVLAIITTIQVSDVEKEFQEYSNKELNPFQRMLDENMKELNTLLEIETSPGDNKENSDFKIALSLFLFNTDTFNRFVETSAIATFIWILIVAVSMRCIYLLLKQKSNNTPLTVIFIVITSIALMYGIYIGQFLLILICGAIVGLICTIID